MTAINCYRCKIDFHVPDYWYTTRVQDHHEFWCPNGHAQAFREGPTEADKLRRERDLLKQQIAQRDDWIVAERTAKEKAERKLKRVALGVCQCCNRSFTNLARHMSSKHPETVKPRLVAEKIA